MTPGRRVDARLAVALAVLGLVLLATALHAPYLDNPLVFDDRALFSGRMHADIAGSPFALEPRRPANFSIAFVQVEWGSIQAHRLASVALHAGCGIALLAALLALRVTLPPAFLGAALFAVHPAGIYAAAYLAQRATVLATLFSLLSLALFARGLGRQRHGFALAAAGAYWLAVLSKEHSILVPAAVLLAIPLFAVSRPFALRYGLVYAACCVPPALLVLFMRASLLGSTYEPALDTLGPHLGAMANAYPAGSAWLASVLTQAGLFFRYVGIWVWPDVARMAIDMPLDLAAAWAPGRAAAAVSAFLAFGAAGLGLLLRGGRLAPAGFGLLFFWILFFVEFSSVRFQEPFVLYRSYLWAPGLAVTAAVLLGRLPRAAAAAAGIAAAFLLFHAAHDRLSTFASSVALWTDAAEKLPQGPVPGAPRVFFNLAREQFYAGEAGKAAATADECIRRYPDGFYCHFGRGSLRLQQGNFEQALPDLERALSLQPRSGMAHHHRGVALEGAGRLREARAAYETSRKLGFRLAAYRLRLLDEGQGAPVTTRSAAPRPD